MIYKFEKFENRHARLEERITITKSNAIGFPAQFYNQNHINDFKYAVLFWDTENHAIGINFTNEEGEKKNAFLIAKSKIGYGGSISAKSFFKHYKVDPKIYFGRYDWEKHTEPGIGDLYVINLKAKSME